MFQRFLIRVTDKLSDDAITGLIYLGSIIGCIALMLSLKLLTLAF